jgi:hypothetical protein
VSGIGALGKEIGVSVGGQLKAEIEAVFLCQMGDAHLSIHISDINYVIQRQPGAVSLFYTVSIIEVPSIVDILLMDPRAIVDAVDNLFKLVNDLTLGRRGIITNFPVPFIGTAISKSLKAGSSDNFLEKARRTVKGALDQILATYEVDDGESTAADLIANVLTDLLGNRLGILLGDVSVTYFEHNGEVSLVPHNSYSKSLDVKSLMWEIPFGVDFTIELPPLNFDLDNKNFPVQIKLESSENPSLNLICSLKLGFGFDEKDGFFIYTYRE